MSQGSPDVVAEANETDAIRRREQHFRRMVEKLPTGAYTCDTQGLITYFNPEAVRLWGREPKLNNPVDRFCGSLKLFSTDGSPIHHDQCWMALALQDDKGCEGEEIVIERPDGERVHALAYVNPIRDPAGKIIGASNVLVDITSRKEAEEALRLAKKEADRANAAKSEFMSRVSHELRTPLNAILGFGQLLEGEQRNAENVENLEQILVAGRHLLALINELLEIAEIETSRTVLSPEPVETHEVVREIASLVKALAQFRRVAINLAPCTGSIMADRRRLKQVLLNLLANAIKYNRPEGRVTIAAGAQASGTVRISIVDTGYGIAPADMSKLFTPFERLTAACGTVEGIGLGLSISKRIVELMGGQIGAESLLGHGSTFWVEFPRSGATVELSPHADATTTGL